MKKLFKYFLVICLLLALWITADWYWPVKVAIREFNPQAVGTMDAEMWHSYYARERVKMYFQLTRLLRSEFKAPFWRSNIIAYHAARAAFVFKKGHALNDYEKALPELEKYYREIHRLSKDDFDIDVAAKTELEWWIVHRDKQQYNYNDLQAALQKNVAAIYALPDSVFNRYAFYRTKAMKLRDEDEVRGGVSEKDWQTIEADLVRSWTELYKAVHTNGAS